jgi:outer membrane protein assembly factor BamB
VYNPGWTRDLHIRWARSFEHKEKLLVTERECYLVCISPDTGESIWESKVNNAYGWITACEDKVYYLGQDGVLKILDFYTGQSLQGEQFYFPYLGFVLVKGDYLITGSWRGYTNLACYNIESDFKLAWEKDTKSKELKNYSIPLFWDDSLIFLDNSNQLLKSFELKTGFENWSISLPENIGSLDLDYSFKIDNEKVYVYSKDGRIYFLEKEELIWRTVVKHSTGIKTVKPKILNSQFLFQDSENYICSYDKFEGNLNWKIYSNHVQTIIPAIEISSELTLLCLSMHRKLIIDKSGEIILELPSERRYGSDLIEINGDIFYLTRSQLKQLKRD